jgi:hypothetical protein
MTDLGRLKADRFIEMAEPLWAAFLAPPDGSRNCFVAGLRIDF